MIQKPMLVPPPVKSPDYEGFIRQQLSKGKDAGNPFALTLAEQESSIRQKIVASASSGDASAASAAEKQALVGPQASLSTRMGLTQGMASSASTDDAPVSVKTNAPLVGIELSSRRGAQNPKELGGHSQGLALRGSSSAMLLSPGAGLALDSRSLSTLQRLEKQGTGRPVVKKTTENSDDLGSLSARYESGNKGAEAIGYDRNGGTSYGKYQISSRQGTFDQFLDFLAKEAPDLEARLQKAGKANTGGTRGAMPTEWKAIAGEEGERFEKLQEDFIRASHYQPALEGVEAALGVELNGPLKQVLWSTAVQHGPTGAMRIFERAAGQLEARGKGVEDEKALIETVYQVRKGQFMSSSPGVQSAVRQRFEDEKGQALAMLKEQVELA